MKMPTVRDYTCKFCLEKKTDWEGNRSLDTKDTFCDDCWECIQNLSRSEEKLFRVLMKRLENIEASVGLLVHSERRKKKLKR